MEKKEIIERLSDLGEICAGQEIKLASKDTIAIREAVKIIIKSDTENKNDR